MSNQYPEPVYTGLFYRKPKGMYSGQEYNGLPQQAPPQQYYYAPQQYPQRQVTSYRKDTAHTAHLVMTVVTFGVWGIFIWAPLTIIRAVHKKKEVTYSQ